VFCLIGGIFRFALTAFFAFFCYCIYQQIFAEEARLGLSSWITVKLTEVTYEQLVILYPVFVLHLFVGALVVSLTTLSKYNPAGYKKIKTGKLITQFFANFVLSSIVGLVFSLAATFLWPLVVGKAGISPADHLPGIILRTVVFGVFISWVLTLFFGFLFEVEKKEG
jgi:hypothetical protein